MPFTDYNFIRIIPFHSGQSDCVNLSCVYAVELVDVTHALTFKIFQWIAKYFTKQHMRIIFFRYSGEVHKGPKNHTIMWKSLSSWQ